MFNKSFALFEFLDVYGICDHLRHLRLNTFVRFLIRFLKDFERSDPLPVVG